MKFADRLRAAWAENPVPKTRLASACKVSKGAVTQWFSGDTRPKSEAAMLLAQELGVSLDWLVLGKLPMRGKLDMGSEGKLARDGDPPAYYTSRYTPDLAAARQLPLFEWSDVGKCPEPDEAAVVPIFYSCSRPCGSRSYALKVRGDSMFPVYRDGEIIFVDPDGAAEHNKDVVLRTNEGATFKRLQHTPEGSYLLSINPDQPERITKLTDSSHICGVIIASYMER